MGCFGSNTSFADIKHATLKNGETLSYREQMPKSPPTDKSGEKVLIFIHATMCSAQMLVTGGLLDKLAEALPHYRIIAPDLRGNGHSTYNKKITKLDDFADDIKEFTEELKIEKYVLLGTCLGGFVSHRVAMNNPKVEALIVVGGLLHLGGAHMMDMHPKDIEDAANLGHYKHIQPHITKNEKEEVKKACEGFHAKTWTTSTRFPELLDEIMLSRNLKEVFYGEAIANTSSEDNGKVKGSGDVSKITCKTLIIHGKDDKAIPIAHAEKFQKAVKGSTLVALDAAHFTWYDKLDETVAPIKEFLK